MGKGNYQATLGNVCADQGACRQNNALAGHGRRHGKRRILEIGAAQLILDICNAGQVEPLRPSRAVVEIGQRGVVDQGVPEQVPGFP